MHNSNADKLAQRLQTRTAQAGVSRLDMSMHDSARIDESTARILIAFESKLGNPSTQAIENFVHTRFHGELEANAATIRYHLNQPQPAVSVIASVKRITRPFADVKNGQLKTVVANTLYMDQTIDANWEVRQNEETGKKYLALVRNVDLDGLLGAAQNKFATASFTGMRSATASISPEKGDHVRFFAQDGLRCGEVSKIKGNEAVINEDDGGTFTVNFQSVLEILKKSEKRLSREEAELVDQLTPTMGDRGLAEELVRTGAFRRK